LTAFAIVATGRAAFAGDDDPLCLPKADLISVRDADADADTEASAAADADADAAPMSVAAALANAAPMSMLLRTVRAPLTPPEPGRCLGGRDLDGGCGVGHPADTPSPTRLLDGGAHPMAFDTAHALARPAAHLRRWRLVDDDLIHPGYARSIDRPPRA
jgi:hypothetical protein